MFKLLILLCLPLIHSKWIDGTIKTLESWTYISKFAFKGPGVFSDYTFFKIPQGKINIRAVFPSHVKLSFHLYFDSVPDIQKDSTIPASHKIEDFHSAANWKEVYESGRDCQWRDLQSRRHGNSFDLYNRYTYVSKSGKGTPYSYLLNRDAVNPSTISKEWEAKTPSSPQNQSYHPEVVGNWIATTASKNTISLKNNLPSGDRSMFKINNVVKYSHGGGDSITPLVDGRNYKIKKINVHVTDQIIDGQDITLEDDTGLTVQLTYHPQVIRYVFLKVVYIKRNERASRNGSTVVIVIVIFIS